MVDYTPPPDLLKMYNSQQAIITSEEYSINSDDNDKRYAKVENMINKIADKLRRANPILSKKPTWWNENNKLFITAFKFGIIDSIQLISTNETMSPPITYDTFIKDYQNIDMFLSSFLNKKIVLTKL
jgi:hypothetical protein